MLSGLKDTDREILKYVDDKQLLKICSIDRKTWNEVCDDAFLRRRLIGKYPGIDKYKKENETWKHFFLNAIQYISLMKERFEFDYTGGDFIQQYNLLKKYKSYKLLFEAAEHGFLSLVKYAVDQGASIHFQSDYVLVLASRYGHLDVVKYLVEQGADINTFDNLALRMAIQNNHHEVVKYLSNYRNLKSFF